MNAEQLLTHFDRLAEAPDAVPRLRRFILDLAVRGKLVDQDASDEPVAELLQLIRLERSRVLKKSALEPSPAVLGDIETPVGWSWSRLGDLCTKTGSGSTPAGGRSAYPDSGVPFLRSQNVYDDGLRLEGVAFISEMTHERMKSTAVMAGDLLLNITGGSIGRCAVVPDDFQTGNISQHVAILRLAIPECARFLHIVIRSEFFQRHIFGNQTGAGREGLPKNRMDEILIPVAPLDEQHRIVAKVDELMALCEQLEAAQQERERRRDRLAAASVQRLDQLPDADSPEIRREHARFHLDQLPRLYTRPEHIKALRQEVLRLAVRGRLVSQSEADDVAIFDRTISDEAFGIPSSWVWVSVADVADTRLGKMLDKAKNKGTPRRYLRNVNVRWFDFDLADVLEMRFEDSELDEFSLRDGDVLICEGGEPGRAAVWDERESDIYFQKAIHRVRFREIVNPHFFVAVLREAADSGRLAKYFTGVGIKHFTGKGLASFAVPLPPPAEQHRIVAKVDELMRLCDQLHAQLSAIQTDSRRLLENLLDRSLGIAIAHSRPKSVRPPPSIASVDDSTGKVSRFMTKKPALTIDQLIECIDELGGATTPERLLNHAGLSEDLETFYDLLRAARDSGRISVPLGAGAEIRSQVDAN